MCIYHLIAVGSKGTRERGRDQASMQHPGRPYSQPQNPLSAQGKRPTRRTQSYCMFLSRSAIYPSTRSSSNYGDQMYVYSRTLSSANVTYGVDNDDATAQYVNEPESRISLSRMRPTADKRSRGIELRRPVSDIRRNFISYMLKNKNVDERIYID